MQPLKLGSRGEEVTKLQQMLKDAGFFPKSQATTQYFGPITQKALQDFQKSRGLAVDGVYNPQAQQTLSNNPETKRFHEQLIQAGNYQGAAQYKQMVDSGNPDAIVIAKGFQMPTGLTPQAIEGFRQTAQAEYAKYFDDMSAKTNQDTDSFLQSSLQDYNSTTDNLKSRLGQDVNALNNNEGIQGTWASSARQERLDSLQNTYNTSFRDLYNKTLSNMQNKLRDSEYQNKYTPQTQLNLNQANISQTQSPQFTSTSSNVYNPFGFAGRQQAERQSAVNTQANNLAQAQMYNPFK